MIEDSSGRTGPAPSLTRIDFVVLAIAVAVLVGGYWSGLDELVRRWMKEEEYSHGLLLPLVSLFFLYQEWPRIRAVAGKPAWSGLAVVAGAALFYLVGEISALYILVHYAFIGTLFGLALGLLGWRGALRTLVPLVILVFAIPLPYFLQADLSGNLQLLSSAIGVAIIDLLSIPVYLEGNVIDLGSYQLQVVDACSGLRYLFPLASLGFICACIFRVETWKRVLVFFSTVPITVLMNSFRIAVIGVLVDRYGIAMAEGFMHDFEGWTIFAVCLAILTAEMWLLTRIGRRVDFRQVFGIDEREQTAAGGIAAGRRVSPVLAASTLLLAASVLLGHSLQQRVDIAPPRKPLVLFPDRLGDWSGQPGSIEDSVVRKLQLSDYVIADYRQGGLDDVPVNFYVAYYENQRKGASPHSPRVCIPGGGWEITEISREELPFTVAGRTLRYNRAVIQHGQNRELVYYWFQQRGRIMANEYEMKWYLFLDALRQNRSDGALVRLTTPVGGPGGMQAAEERLQRFAAESMAMLPRFVPD